VKVDRGKLPWFIWWTRVFTWSTSEVKAVWIKPLLAQDRYNKCKHLSYVLCAAFFQECISIMIMGFPINEIPPHGEKVLQR
jgi:hypothetical protein